MTAHEIVSIFEEDLEQAARYVGDFYAETATTLLDRTRRWRDGEPEDVADIGNKANGLLRRL